MQQNPQKTLEIVSVQVEPIICSLDQNMDRCKKLLDSKLKFKPNPDIIVFPETAMSGYIMKSKKKIDSVSELCGQGKQFEYYKQIAKENKSYVFAGYYEKMTKEEMLQKKGKNLEIGVIKR